MSNVPERIWIDPKDQTFWNVDGNVPGLIQFARVHSPTGRNDADWHPFLRYPLGRLRKPEDDIGKCWFVTNHHYCGQPADAEIHQALPPTGKVSEEDEALVQIQKRLAAHRQEVAKYRNKEWAKGNALHYYEAPDDVAFLLSALATVRKATLLQAARDVCPHCGSRAVAFFAAVDGPNEAGNFTHQHKNDREARVLCVASAIYSRLESAANSEAKGRG